MSASVASSKSQPPKPRKRVDVDPSTLKRATNGSAFTNCDYCKKDIPVATADMHDCKLDGKARGSLEHANKPVEVVKGPVVNEQTQDKKVQKRGAKESNDKPSKAKKIKKVKDPNQPKKPATAFFVFMEDFRKSYKELHPDAKGVAMVAKEGGEKWKSMSDEDKAIYVKKAAEMKEQYVKVMKAFTESSGQDDKENEEEVPEDGRINVSKEDSEE